VTPLLLAALLAATQPEPEAPPAIDLRPFVYVQGDAHRVLGGDRADDLRDAFEVRRLRLGGEARWRRLRVELDVDPLEGEQWLKDAYLELRPGRRLRLRGGWQKLPTLAGREVGAARTDFVERSIAADRLAPGRDLGLSLRARAGRCEVLLGAFAGDGYRESHRAGWTAAGRLELAPLRSLVLGGLVTSADVPDSVTPRGRDVEGPSGLELFPDHAAQGRRLRIGADAAWGGPGVRLSAEILRQAEDTPANPLTFRARVVSLAWAGAALWRRGGGKDDGRGGFIPRKTGALGLGVRLEGAWQRDPVQAVRPSARAFTAGFGWRPRSFLLVMVNLVHERLDSGPANRRSRTTAFARLQLEAPVRKEAP
jgi:phosphate-selective porin